MKPLSRRTFLKLSGAAAAGALVSACTPSAAPAPTQAPGSTEAAPTLTQPPAPAATSTQLAAATPTLPAATATVAAAPKTYRRPEALKFFPAVKSKVVQSSDPGVWQGESVDPAAVRKLLDKSILALSGLSDVKAAWQALFQPDEKIAIKVNAFRNSTIWTHPELVKAVTDSLQEAGIPGEQITIFDYSTDELKEAKYPVNKDGPGVRCFGTDDQYAASCKLSVTTVKLSDILSNCDALINMPVLKSHMIAGFTFALKNHYGSVLSPDALHDIAAALPPLNGLAPIRETTRLVIGDVLHANTQFSNSWPYWEADIKGDSILVSFDPLAHDLVGLELLKELATKKGSPTEGILYQSQGWIQAAAQAGLGAGYLKDVEWVKV